LGFGAVEVAAAGVVVLELDPLDPPGVHFGFGAAVVVAAGVVVLELDPPGVHFGFGFGALDAAAWDAVGGAHFGFGLSVPVLVFSFGFAQAGFVESEPDDDPPGVHFGFAEATEDFASGVGVDAAAVVVEALLPGVHFGFGFGALDAAACEAVGGAHFGFGFGFGALDVAAAGLAQLGLLGS
jgi:hypothetical protein